MKIIQIGANRGNDHVTQLVRTLDIETIELLLLVEPISMVIEDLTNCYSFMKDKVSIEQVAIVTTETTKEIEMFYAPVLIGPEIVPSYELSSLNKNHLNGHVSGDISKIESFMVPCTTINNLLDKYNIVELDYLFVDAEGMDAEIIKSLNLTKYTIKNIQLERLHGGDSASGYLLDNGYTEHISLDPNGYDKMFRKVGV